MYRIHNLDSIKLIKPAFTIRAGKEPIHEKS